MVGVTEDWTFCENVESSFDMQKHFFYLIFRRRVRGNIEGLCVCCGKYAGLSVLRNNKISEYGLKLSHKEQK